MIKKKLAAAPCTNAAIRTTTAPTIISGGAKDNVLPIGASATVNFRLPPGDSLAAVLRRVRKIVAKGLGQEASSVSRTDNAAFGTLHRTIKGVFPQALVAPYTVLGATNARTYTFLCPQATYRFSPLLMDQKAIESMHDTNEQLRTAEYSGRDSVLRGPDSECAVARTCSPRVVCLHQSSKRIEPADYKSALLCPPNILGP